MMDATINNNKIGYYGGYKQKYVLILRGLYDSKALGNNCRPDQGLPVEFSFRTKLFNCCEWGLDFQQRSSTSLDWDPNIPGSSLEYTLVEQPPPPTPTGAHASNIERMRLVNRL